MTDFVLRQVEGWLEISGFEALYRRDRLDIRAFWSAAGTGDTEAVAELLDQAGLLPLEMKVGDVTGARLIALPDDRQDTVHRLWIRRRKEAQDWSARKR